MSVDQAYNFKRIDERVATAGLLNEEHLGQLKAEGFEVVINLLPDSLDYAIKNEADIVQAQGLSYHYIPVDFDAPTAADYAAFAQVFSASDGKQLLLHCAANYRASAFYAVYAFEYLGWTAEQAMAHIRSIWNPDDYPAWAEFIQQRLGS